MLVAMKMAGLIISGLAFGSFINAYVWRVYKQTEVIKGTSKKKIKNKTFYSIVSGRSMCPKCEHALKTFDLVPILSWLSLRGKCRYCHNTISFQYPFVEAITVILFLTSYAFWPQRVIGLGLLDFIFWLIYLVNLIALAVYDIKWMTLPNRMVYPVFGFVILQILITIVFYHGDYHYLLGLLYGFIIGGGVFYLLFQISSGQWIGGGDVKLGAILGLILGSGTYAVLIIFLSSLIGTILALPLLIFGKVDRKTMIPYGPYLILATIIIRLFGGSLISWFRMKGIYI